MLAMSAALKAHLAQPYQTTCTLWLCQLTNGTVVALTDHDENVGPFLGNTYLAAEGYTRTDIAGGADLSVDNVEVAGLMRSPAITDADLMAGIWDYAQITVALVNWADLSMGAAILRKGRIGDVTLGRDVFRANLHGLSQFYARTIGENTSAGCRAALGDARCKVDLTAFTVAGSVTGTNATDPTIFYDTSIINPGPTGGIAIIAISHADPGVVSMAAATGLFNGLAVTLSGIVGPDELNNVTTVRNLDATALRFDLPISTLPLPVYVSGGTVTPLGSSSGYFDNGVVTWVSGLNAGRSMEVLSYVPGQFRLMEPMPYAVTIGDTYTVVAGCDKSLATCKTKFANVANMRAEPYLPGNDRIMQVGKQA